MLAHGVQNELLWTDAIASIYSRQGKRIEL